MSVSHDRFFNQSSGEAIIMPTRVAQNSRLHFYARCCNFTIAQTIVHSQRALQAMHWKPLRNYNHYTFRISLCLKTTLIDQIDRRKCLKTACHIRDSTSIFRNSYRICFALLKCIVGYDIMIRVKIYLGHDNVMYLNSMPFLTKRKI